MPQPIITLPYAEITYISDDIIRLVLDRDIIRLSDARGIIDAFNDINPEGQTKGYLVNFNHIGYITKNARDYLRIHEDLESEIAAVVILANNPFARIIGAFFLGWNAPENVDIKMMKDPKTAIEWLESKIKQADAEAN